MRAGSQDLPIAARRFRIAPIIVYPLVGPPAAALAIGAPVALMLLLTTGPAGLGLALVNGPPFVLNLYALFGLPFLLTGVLVALAGFVFKRWSLPVALIAAELAYFAYYGSWSLASDAVETLVVGSANLRTGLLRNPGIALLFLAGTAGCWFVARTLERRASTEMADLASPQRTHAWEMPVLVGMAIVGASALAAVFATYAPTPAEAWKDCMEWDTDRRRRGCTVILERASEEPADRRVTAYMNRASVTEDRASAIADYSEAIRLKPELAQAYAWRGLAHARQRKGAEAIADIDAALRLDANVLGMDTFALFRARALAHFRRGDFDHAIADHTEEVRLKPHYTEGWLHRAAAYLAKGDAARAIADFSNAIRVEPWNTAGYIERGSVYLAQGDTDRAIADFDEAIRRRPDLRTTAPAYRKRGEILEKKGDVAGAFNAFEKAFTLNPSDPEAAAGLERTRAALSRSR